MKPQPERLNDRLDELLQARHGAETPGELHAPALAREDEEVNELLEIAHYLQSVPTLRADTEFAQRLERRVRVHAIKVRQERATLPWWQTFYLRPLRAQIAFAVTTLCLLGTGTVAMAAQGATPTSPLYPLKSWVQNVQITLATSPVDRAELAQQIVRDHLNALKTLTNPTQEEAYNHELASLQQQLHVMSQIINTVQNEKDRSRLNGEYTALQAEVRHSLYSLLPSLTRSEQLATTSELESLGEKVTHVNSVSIVVSSPPHPQAKITFTGDNFQPGAQLLINNQLVSATGTLQDGVYTFVVDWNGKQQPNTVSLLNTNSTLAQTTSIAFSTVDASGKNVGSSNPGKSGTGNDSSSHEHGNGNPSNNGGGKPAITPTPRH